MEDLFNMAGFSHSRVPAALNTFSYLMNSPIGLKFPNDLAAGLPGVNSLGELCIGHSNVQYISLEDILRKVGDGREEGGQPC